jgi:hypothetical protein
MTSPLAKSNPLPTSPLATSPPMTSLPTRLSVKLSLPGSLHTSLYVDTPSSRFDVKISSRIRCKSSFLLSLPRPTTSLLTPPATRLYKGWYLQWMNWPLLAGIGTCLRVLIAGSIEPASNMATIYLGSQAGSNYICLYSVLYCFLMLRDRLRRSFIYGNGAWHTPFSWISLGFLLPISYICDHRIYTYLYIQLRCREIYSRDAGFSFKRGHLLWNMP